MADFFTLPGEELGPALRRASVFLDGMGVKSAQADSELLAAYLLEQRFKEPVSRGRVQALSLLGVPAPEGFARLVNLRGERVPLQHITGQAHFRGLTLSVGPGVFIPRPETELLVEHALADYQRRETAGTLPDQPVLVDLCAGSGAIAASLVTELTGVEVFAVELSNDAAAWAKRNLEGTKAHLVVDDARTALEELRGQVTLVASNPPYIPAGAVPKDPEVREHDPERALYGGGADGMDLPRAIAYRAYELLAPGGYLIMEHAETQRELMRGTLEEAGFVNIESIDDLAGKPRHTSGYRPVPQS